MGMDDSTLDVENTTESKKKTEEEEPNCNICFEPYDDENHCPRTLRCGHTLCTPCIDILVKRSLPDRVCPECRKTLKISRIEHLPISYTILRLSRALAQVTPVPEIQVQVLDNNTCMKHGAPTISWCPVSDDWHCFKCVHTDKCDGLLSVPEAFLHIKQNYSQVIETKIQNANKLSMTLKREKEAAKKDLESHQKNLEDIEERLNFTGEWINKLEADDANLIEANTTIRLTKSLKRLKRNVNDFDAFIERSQPSVKSKNPTTTPALPKFSSQMDFATLRGHLAMTQIMYAVHEDKENGKRWSKISVDGNFLCMYALDDSEPLPENATTVEYKSFMAGMSSKSPITFFEVQYDFELEGKVYFEMFGQTPRAKQFINLCTAVDGQSYVGSRLMEFEEDNHRYIRGGVVGSVIFEDPTVKDIAKGGVYRKALEPGMLHGWNSDTQYWSLFDVVLECKQGYEDDFTFGEVRVGLSLLKGLCDNDKKKPIEIRNCGVAIEL